MFTAISKAGNIAMKCILLDEYLIECKEYIFYIPDGVHMHAQPLHCSCTAGGSRCGAQACWRPGRRTVTEGFGAARNVIGPFLHIAGSRSPEENPGLKFGNSLYVLKTTL